MLHSSFLRRQDHDASQVFSFFSGVPIQAYILLLDESNTDSSLFLDFQESCGWFNAMVDLRLSVFLNLSIWTWSAFPMLGEFVTNFLDINLYGLVCQYAYF